MLHYLRGRHLAAHPLLRDSMFFDRGLQFSARLGWDVALDDAGHERDEYDGPETLYAIWQSPNGYHGGSLRFLPLTGRTMLEDHFSRLLPFVWYPSRSRTWEISRFCVSPRQPADEQRRAAAALVLACGEVMEGWCATCFVAVFDAPALTVYRRAGMEPAGILGSEGEGRRKLSAGVWHMKEAAWAPTLERVGVTRYTSRDWLHDSPAYQEHIA